MPEELSHSLYGCAILDQRDRDGVSDLVDVDPLETRALKRPAVAGLDRLHRLAFVLDDVVREAGPVGILEGDPRHLVHRDNSPALTPVANLEEWVQPVDEIAVTNLDRLRTLGTLMKSGKELVERPLSPVPTVSGTTIVIPACPAGTRLEIFDKIGMERMLLDENASAETYNFLDPGVYLAEVEAPEPYLPTCVELEVTA